MKGWQRSGLTMGEKLIIPSRLFIEPTKAVDRLISTTYVGETDAGLMVECTFIPPVGHTKPSHYRMMLNWASIYCGAVHVQKEDGSTIYARRVEPVVEIK